MTRLGLAVLLAALVVPLGAAPAQAAAPYTYRFPVIGNNGFGGPGTHSVYPAADILAECGRRVVAPIAGTVLEAEAQDLWAQGYRSGAHNGGVFVSILGIDGVRYYMSHLSAIADGIGPGVALTAGQQIGLVGRTGHAGTCHLHFGISPLCAGTGDWWIRRGVVWPNRFLRTWKKAKVADESPQQAVGEWAVRYGCPASELDLPSWSTSLQPTNDGFAWARTAKVGLRSTESTGRATLEASETAPTCDASIGSTVWYAFTPARNRKVVVQTGASNFDTVLAVYTGPDLESLTQLTCNDNATRKVVTSKVAFKALAGTTYYIQVGGKAGASGTLVLKIRKR